MANIFYPTSISVTGQFLFASTPPTGFLPRMRLSVCRLLCSPKGWNTPEAGDHACQAAISGEPAHEIVSGTVEI